MMDNTHQLLHDYYLRGARVWARPALIVIAFFCPLWLLAGSSIFGITDSSPVALKTFVTISAFFLALSVIVLALGIRRDSLVLLRLGAPIAPFTIVPLALVADLPTGASSHVYGTLMVALALVAINNRPLIWLNVLAILAEVWIVTLLVHPVVSSSLLIESAALLFLGGIAGQIRASLDQRLLDEMVLRQEAEAAARSRSAMLETVAHDLRTPLHVVVNLAKLLHSGWYAGGTPAREDQFEVLERIEGSGETLSHQLEQLLEAAQLDSETATFDTVTPADLQGIGETLRGLLEAKKLRYAVSVNLPGPVRSDVDRLRPIIQNLVTNAAKFTPEGGMVSLLCMADREHTFYVEVSDSGEGIPSEQIPLLFQPFRQVKADARGVGLGLYIIKRNAALIGGEIDVKSTVGVGTTIRVTFKEGVPR